ncbi:S-adenosyl-L-methionine-dependent methyltransferase [Byssothecium circinans]|uniref:S-adenosyl-L-methionine-dependent methyltransferase n=1 Tax=Byssothecium circinans TaxID=147558 RepID=A0A6A5TP68_9PLEO|nr:S-adenosyl-L-methionine-dependent methyltransferase [Byssothecium circinans]
MASLDPKTKSTYATTDWEHYRQGRPPYPQSLTRIIYGYRSRHPSAQWTRLVDIGAGSGVASTNFMPDFKVLHISDPSAANLDQARTFLPNWAQTHGHNPTLEYSVASGEEAHVGVGEGNADLVICATAAHFIDPDGLAESIARMLRPGGTMAVFSYWMPTFPGRSKEFHDVFERVWDELVVKSLLSGEKGKDDPSQTRLAKVVQRRMSGKGVLDSVPIPQELFTDAQRVYINAKSGEIAYRAIFEKFLPAGGEPWGIAKVDSGEKIVHYATGTDEEAEGWLFEVDRKWLSNFVNTIRPANSNMTEEEAREAYAEWNKVFDEECGDGVLRVLWPAYLVLATRK